MRRARRDGVIAPQLRLVPTDGEGPVAAGDVSWVVPTILTALVPLAAAAVVLAVPEAHAAVADTAAPAVLAVAVTAGADIGTDPAVISTATSTVTVAVAATAASGAPVDFSAILSKAGSKALGGGKSGAAAGVAQVLLLMWLRTTMNFQYRYGTTTREAFSTLWAEGGVRRLYTGLPLALVQAPLSRFGDVAANAGARALLDAAPPPLCLLPGAAKTAAGSAAAAAWRVVIMPVDTAKTSLQVWRPWRPFDWLPCHGH